MLDNSVVGYLVFDDVVREFQPVGAPGKWLTFIIQ
jgi:hypothetical protein